MPRKTRQEAEREARERREREQRERERRLPPPVPPRMPAPRREPELAPTPEVRERRERAERERRPPPPKVDWWLDPKEQQAIMQEAQRIVREQVSPIGRPQFPVTRPEFDREARGLRIPPMTPLPSMGEEVFAEPRRPTPGPGWAGRSMEAIRAGLAVPGVPPPGFVGMEEPRTPREAMSEYMKEARRRWGGLATEDIPAPLNIEGRGVPVSFHPFLPAGLSRVLEPSGLYLDPGALLQQLKKIPGGGGIVSGIEFGAHALLTGLGQLDFIPERGLGALVLRNLRPPEEVRAVQEAIDERRRTTPKLYIEQITGEGLPSPPKLYIEEMMGQSLERYPELYEALQDPELSEEERAWLTNDYLPRIAWSGVDSWLEAIPRLEAGEEPDVVLAEEADPVRELVGNLIVSLDWPLGMAAVFWKETRLARKITRFWTVPTEALPHWLTGAGRARKGIIERLVPWELTRGAKANALTNVTSSAISNAVRVYGDDVDGIRAVLRGIGDDEGFNLFMQGIKAHPESEGARAFRLLATEEGFADDLVGLLEGRVSARQLTELGEEAKGVKVFVPGEFLDEAEALARRTSEEAFHVGLDRPWKYNIPAKLGNALKSHLSDFWLGLNPGYVWRNAYNNFATLTIDNLIDGYSFQPRKRADFLDVWFGEGVRPSAMRPGLGATPATPARTARGELVGAGGRGRLPMHRAAAANENFCREIAWVTALRRWRRKQWDRIGPMFPRTLRNYVTIDPDLEGRIYHAVGDSLRYEDDVDAVKKVLGAVGGPDDVLPEESRLAGTIRQWIPDDAEVRDSTVGQLQGFYDDLAADGDVERFRLRGSGLIDDLRTEYMVGRGRDGFVPNAKHGAWQLVDNPGLTPYTGDMPTPYHVFPGYLRRIEEDGLGWGFEAKRRAQLDLLEEMRGIARHEIRSPEGTMPMTIMREKEKWAYAKRILEQARDAGRKLSDEEQAFLAQEKFVPMYRSPAHVPDGPLSAAELDEKVLEFRRVINARKAQLLRDSGIDNAWLAKNLDLDPAQAEQLGERLFQWGMVNGSWDPKGYRNVLSYRLPDQIDYTTLMRERSRITDLKNSSGGVPDPSSVGLGEYFRAQMQFFEGKTDDMPVLRDYISPLDADEIARPEYIVQLASDRRAVEALNGELVDGLVERVRRGEIGPEDLRAAIQDGVLTEEQAGALVRLGQGAGDDFMGIGRPAPYGVYHSDALESAIEGEIRFVGRVLEDGPPSVVLPPDLLGRGGDGLLPGINSWLKQDVAQARAAFKLTGEMYAKELADFALLDYGRRHNLDLWMAMVMPYPYWRTYTGVNWLQRTMTKPWAFNAYRGLRDATRKVRADMPTRLQDAGIDIEAPWLSEWLGEWTGDRLMMDPVRLIFAPVETWPLNSVWETQWDDPAEAENELQLLGSFTDAMQMRFYPWIDWGQKLLSGEGLEKEYYLFPQTSFLKGLTAMLWERNIGREGPELDVSWLPESLRDALGWGETVDLSVQAGGVNVEALPRRLAGGAVGMSEFELPSSYYYEEFYWPVAHLVFMLESGEIDKETYEEVKYDRLYRGNRENEIWQKAYNRAAVQKAVPAVTGFLLGQRWKMYPAAEERIRSEQDEWRSLLWSPEQPYGSAEAGQAYREAHPELSARGGLFAMMGPSIRFYKRADGTYDLDGYREERAEWEARGGMAGEAGQQYELYQYFKADQALDEMEGQLHNDLVKEGFIPGTRGFRVVDGYIGELREAHYDRYRDLWQGYEPSVAFGASPAEHLEWVEQQQSKELADVYWDIKPENFADAEGEIDWDGFYGAREAALDALPDEVRFNVEKRIRRSRIPEEEIMAVLEDQVYGPLSDIIGMVAEEEDPDIKKALQEEIDALEERMDDLVVGAIADSVSGIMEYHPDWTEAEQARMLGYQPPGFETWRRSRMEPRSAFENAFRTFYWGLPPGVRSVTYRADKAEKAGVPQSYLGADFEAFQEENPKLEGLGDISDEQLLDWLGRVGVLGMLAQEGFAIPGQELPETLRRAYEGLEPRPEVVAEELAAVGEYPLAAETEAMRAQMEEAIAGVAISGEETKEPAVETAAAQFELPDADIQARIASAMAGLDVWIAGGREGEWTEDMEWWLGDPNSPKSKYWALRRDIFATPEENNAMGWGTIPDELRDTLITAMINDAYADGTQTELGDEVFAQALEEMQAYIDEHGEELTQAREEYIGYLAMLSPELEDLQDEYYSYPKGSQERRNLFPQLDDYWTRKREYKEQHPLMVKFYFPGTEVGAGWQPRFGGGGWRRRGRGRRAAPSPGPSPGWSRFAEAAGDRVVGVLIDYWTGQGELDQADREYLQALFKAYPFGAASFEGWLEILRGMWAAGGGGGGGYEIPMRERPVTIPPAQPAGRGGYVSRPPTRVRRLRG